MRKRKVDLTNSANNLWGDNGAMLKDYIMEKRLLCIQIGFDFREWFASSVWHVAGH